MEAVLRFARADGAEVSASSNDLWLTIGERDAQRLAMLDFDQEHTFVGVVTAGNRPNIIVTPGTFAELDLGGLRWMEPRVADGKLGNPTQVGVGDTLTIRVRGPFVEIPNLFFA